MLTLRFTMKSAHESNRFRGHRKERMLAGESIFHVVAATESSRWNARFRSIELLRTSALFNRTPVKSLNEILRLSSPAYGKAHARFSGFSYSAYPISRLACFLSFVSLFPLHFFYFLYSLSLLVSALRFTSALPTWLPSCCAAHLY